MAEKKTKFETDAWRVIAVMLGVLGTCWLFTGSWREVTSYITGYTFDQNFFTYFFGAGALFSAFPLAALMVSLLFLIVSLRDLYPIAKVFALVTAIVCAVILLTYVVYFCLTVRGFADIFTYSFFVNIGRFLLLVGYFLFAMYCRNGGRVKNVAWVIVVIALIAIGCALVYALAAKKCDAEYFLNQIFVLLANLAVMYCGLRKY